MHPLCTSITTRTVIKYNVQLWCWKELNKIILFIIVTNPKELQTEVWHIEYVQCANKFSWQDTLVPITCLFYGRHTVLTQAHTNNDIILVQRGPFLNIFWWWISCRLSFQFISPCYYNNLMHRWVCLYWQHLMKHVLWYLHVRLKRCRVHTALGLSVFF